MFKITSPLVSKPYLVAVSLALNAFSISAQATLTSYNVNGADLVYSSASDVTWTKDANLLGTLVAASGDANNDGVNDVIQAIVAASTNNYGSTSYTVTAGDFGGSFGTSTRWWGANAFISYLNSISYGGSTRWQLPTTANTTFGYSNPSNGTAAGNELSELFYQELTGLIGVAIPNTTIFDNVQTSYYWSATELAQNTDSAWGFYTDNGTRGVNRKRSISYYTWAVSPGEIAAVSSVPEPTTAWLLATGLLLLGGVASRRKLT